MTKIMEGSQNNEMLNEMFTQTSALSNSGVINISQGSPEDLKLQVQMIKQKDDGEGIYKQTLSRLDETLKFPSKLHTREGSKNSL